MRRWTWLVVLVGLVAVRGAAAQVPNPPGTLVAGYGPGTVTPSGLLSVGSANSLPFNVQDPAFGAVPTLNTDQGPAVNNAIAVACGQTAFGQAARPVVFVPPGVYGVGAGGLTVPAGCNGISLKGAGQGISLFCFTGGAAGAPMLTVGVTAAGGANVTDFTMEDVGLSGFCGGTFPKGIDLNCNHCHFNRVFVTGYTVFAIRFAGVASGGANGAGFSTVSDCQVQNGQPSSFAFVFVTQTGSAGGPDGNAINHCYVNTNNGWVNDSAVAGATSLRSSQSFFADRFEAAQNGSPVIAKQGNSQDDRWVGNRLENTGTGGITIALANTQTSDPTAFFVGNLWACGSGLCTFTDASPTKAIRVGESFGPTTTPQPPGLQGACSSATATSSGAGSPVALKSCAIQANTVNSAGSLFLHVRAWGHTANNANAKSVQLLFAGVSLISITLTASVVDTWQCDLVLAFRATGSAAQSVGGECSHGSTPTMSGVTSATPTFDFTIAQTLAAQATQVAAGDIVQDGMFASVCGVVGPGC